jgi:putative ABC transport system permease protein
VAQVRTWEAGGLRLYRGFLFAYPAAFRDEYGRELCLAFADRCREASSRAAMALVWAEAIFGILNEAPKEHLHMIMQDLRYAIRILRKDGAVTAAAVGILALGIGSTTLVFSLANGLLLRPLPYLQPDRLVAVEEYSHKDPNEKGTVSFPNYVDFRSRMRLQEELGVYDTGEMSIVGQGAAERVSGALVSDGVFRALGVAPLVGRTFTREDCLPNGPKVVAISEEFWERRYGRDPNIAGNSLDTANARFTIIGVMPAGFHFPARAEIWFPLQMDPAKSPRTDYFLGAIARLKPGVSVEQATTELQAMLEQIHRENPAANNGWGARAAPIRDSVAGSYRRAVITLLVAVAFLLLIACANVSNLLLLKASGRVREMAVRAALGATRTRLIRQLVSESLLLGAGGGVLGVLLAHLGIPALLALIPVELPRWMDFSVDHRVLGFALALSLLTSIGFGIAPALGSSGGDLTASLKEAGRGGTAGVRQKLLRHGLVVAEVALSVTLLIGAGLMIRSFVALRTQSLGYHPENVLSLTIDYPETRYPDGPQARALIDLLTREVASLPGVISTAFTTEPPMQSSWTRIFTIEGRPVPLQDMPFVRHLVVAPGYFQTLGIPLLQGRDFTPADYDAPHILIVAQAFARKHWPHESAVGKRVRFGPPKNNEPWHTVVGVAADSKQGRLKGLDTASVYLPYSPDVTPHSLIVRTSGDPRQLVKAIRGRIAAADRDIAVSRVFTLEQIRNRVAWQDRFFTVLLGAFAALALALAAVGLYGVLSYTVSLYTHEIGIRMALGAPAASVRRMILRQGLTLAGAGVLVGALAALALTRLLKSQLFEISPMDPATYAIALSTLLAVAAWAAFLPAHRATRVDPVIALRHE